ncbi:MAG: intein-containing DNA gyrase subunit B [Candidatus Taylorbacteria bacterium]|nr:intein-containing DNA gyrase subunit B [Candidatus Taylorbacteria bacterium]
MAKTKEKDTKKSKGGSNGYTAESITVLEGLEPVRKRPGMYIGTTGPDGLHHLITEIFDNSRDEAMGGFANEIEIAFLPDNWIRVVDNGRGIPVDTHKSTKVSALETIMTTLHAGGKFGGDGSGYKVSGGLHGVGASVVNALSVYMKVLVHKNDGSVKNGIYMQEYKRGKAVARVKNIGSTKKQGTVVTFEADPEIFPEIKYDFDRVVAHMRQQAYLVKGLRIRVIDASQYEGDINDEKVFYLNELGLDVPSQSFYFEGGLMSLVKFTNQSMKPIHRNIFYVEKQGVGIESVEVALQYVDDISSRVLPFANNIYNSEGGTHVTGFKTALTRILNNYSKKNGGGKDEDNFTGEDVLEGLTAIISVKMREIQFEGQTKGKLGSVEARGAVETVFGEAFAAFLEENPDDAKMIIGKAALAMKARKAAKAAKDSVLRKGALEGMTLPGKLADCETRSAEESELFIVEGDSAGGCWDGKTKIALADGRDLPFEELVDEYKAGKQNFCYTMRNDGHIGIAPILDPRLTKKSATVIKVILDTDEELICTPDHPFMLVDGSYIPANKLTPEHSIAPLYRKLSKKEGLRTLDGYEMMFDKKLKNWVYTHIASDIYNLEHGVYRATEGSHRHHIDFNKLNNNPTNLRRVSHEEHMAIHYAHLEHTLHRKDVKIKSAEAKREKAFREQARNKSLEKRELFSLNAKKQWENPEYKKFMVDKFLQYYHSNEEYRTKNNELLNENQRRYWSDHANRVAQARRVKDFFATHPEQKEKFRAFSIEQWKDQLLLNWRREETKKQWTPEFRQKRKEAYNWTYLEKALKAFHDIFAKNGQIDYEKYENLRKATNDKALIRWQTIVDRFFEGERTAFEEAVQNYNHRIKAIIPLKEKIDVYDLEVEGTHNFALASGVFVHNSAKQGRDRRTQAILPLKGKILNVERARLDRILGFDEIKFLVIALGTAIGDAFDVTRLRYHKIIIATDADVDGAHIRTLLLTLFYRYFRSLIDGGFIYIAQPPLYKIKKGKEVHYAYSDEEKAKIVGKDMPVQDIEEVEETPAEEATEETEEAEGKEAKRAPKISIQRYKGLGEMNPEELWETTMNPENRILRKVNVEDAQEADKVFDILMGTDVPARKSFIQTNAQKANIDI